MAPQSSTRSRRQSASGCEREPSPNTKLQLVIVQGSSGRRDCRVHMADVFSKRKRSDVMSRIRSRGNRSTELEFAKLLRRNRIWGWRRHGVINLADCGIGDNLRSNRVTPDFVFKAKRVAVFVDGCFWHGCPQHCKVPESNGDFWAAKLQANRDRDRHVDRALRKRMWSVLRVWEHQLNSANRIIERLRRMLE